MKFVYRFVLYGRLGLEIAKAFAESILPFGSTWRAENNLLTKYHPAYNESIDSVTEPSNCLSNAIIRDNITNPVFNLTTLNALKHITAVNIAYRVSSFSAVLKPLIYIENAIRFGLSFVVIILGSGNIPCKFGTYTSTYIRNFRRFYVILFNLCTRTMFKILVTIRIS